jgi:hypothetical protein
MRARPREWEGDEEGEIAAVPEGEAEGGGGGGGTRREKRIDVEASCGSGKQASRGGGASAATWIRLGAWYADVVMILWAWA